MLCRWVCKSHSPVIRESAQSNVACAGILFRHSAEGVISIREVADTFTKRKRSQIMAAVRSKGNKATEGRLIHILRDHRIVGWRRNRRLLGKPDFVFSDSKLAVFVDGCFWHGCQKHLRMPADNRAYWLGKIARNQGRDRATARALRNSGWRVMRIWEHELKFAERVARRLTKALSAASTRVRICRSLKRTS
jgi:DNA mismatch endonuclease (patch repair protein)